MHKVARTAKSASGSANGSPSHQRKSESESDFRPSKICSSGSGSRALDDLGCSVSRARVATAKRPTPDLTNNGDKRSRTQPSNNSSDSMDRAEAYNGDSDSENHSANEESFHSGESNGSATDDDVGDVWDEEAEASFDADEVDGFSECDEDEAASYDNGSKHEMIMTGAQDDQQMPEGDYQEPIKACPDPNDSALDDIPEEEAAELLAVVTAAEEYLSSVASGGAEERNRGKKSAFRPQAVHGDRDNAEKITHDFPTVAPNSSHQRKQKHPEAGGANTDLFDGSAADNKSSTKTRSAAAHLTSAKAAQPAYGQSSIEAADSREDMSVDSASSSKNRYNGGNAPQLHIFSVGETKFPESPSNSKRETLSGASQSSRLSGRSLRSIDRSNASRSSHSRNPSDRPPAHFKTFRSTTAIQHLETGEPCRNSKFRSSPPPPIPDFRPGSPPNEQSPLDTEPEFPSPKRQALDAACLSKLANDIERLLTQLDNELPEEKIRYSTVIRDHERLENSECTLDKKDFRKCYCNVTALSISTAAISGADKTASSDMFLSPSSDAGDLTFYSGDDGEASFVSDISAHMTCSLSLDNEETVDRNQRVTYIVPHKDRARSINLRPPSTTTGEVGENENVVSTSAGDSEPDIEFSEQPPDHDAEVIATTSVIGQPHSAPISEHSASEAAPVEADQAKPPSRFLTGYSTPRTDSAVGRRTCSSSASSTTRLLDLTRSHLSPLVSSRSSGSSLRVEIPPEDKEQAITDDPDAVKRRLEDKIRQLQKLLGRERELRILAEKSEQDARKRLEQVLWKLDQAEKQAAARAELDSKREQELSRLRSEAEKARRDHHSSLDALRKKHSEAVACIEDQLNSARSERSKVERECSKLRAQVQEAQSGVDALTQDKQTSEEQKNKMELKAYEYQLKTEELQGLLAEATGARQRASTENEKLEVQIRESQSRVTEIDKKRMDLQRRVDQLSSSLDDEMKRRQTLTDRVKQLEKENEALRETSVQHAENKKDLNRQLCRANTEISSLHTKLEQCSLAQAELLEQQKNYYTNKLTQAREENETLTGRIASLERIRTQLRHEIDELTVELDKANTVMSGYDKRVIALEKTIREWEQRYNELSKKVVALEDELRAATGELQRSGRHVEDAAAEVAVLRRENQAFKEELQRLQQHVAEVTEALREAEKSKWRLGEEKVELEKRLRCRSAETASKSIKPVPAPTHHSDLQALIDAKMREKDSEFEEARRSLNEAIGGLTTKLDDEKRSRETAVKQRQVFEKRVKKLEAMLADANKARLEATDRVKRINQQNQDLTLRIEKLRCDHDKAVEKCAVAEKRASVLQKEREEMAAALVQVEKSRRELIEQTSALKQEVAEHEASLSQLKMAKQEVESAADNARLNLRQATSAAGSVEAKAIEAEAEKSSMKELLSRERERAARAEQATAELEGTIKELQTKIERLERNGLMSTEGAVARLEQTVRDLEAELKQERQKAHEALRSERGSERLIKELQFQMEQERLQASRMADVVDSLEQKLRVYRRQRQEAEEQANANLVRCRELKHELDHVEGRADAAENVLSRIRAETRGRISGLLSSASPVTPTEVISPLTRRTLTTVLPKRPNTITITKSRLSTFR